MRHICLISGGKDSTALAIYLRDKRPELEVEYLFCDTHKELPETYEYLVRLEAYLGKPITKLMADADERGFDHWLKVYGGYLPSPGMRWCTKKLKIEPFEAYVGDAPVRLYVGIRADERRTGYVSSKPNIEPVFPFKEDGINREDVMRMLEESGVGLPSYYEWRTRSGCYFCFFQRRAEWVGLLERHPELFESAMSYEKLEEDYTWVHGESLVQLSRPERVQDIQEKAALEAERAKSRRRPRTLAEAWGLGDVDDTDDEVGCVICHL